VTRRYRWLVGGSLAGVALGVTVVVLLAVSRAFPGGTTLDPLESRRVYDEYDRAFRASLARATQAVGKEVIKVERLSDRFTVPQKLTIKGTPYEIGLTVGHIGRQAKARLPVLAETDRTLNRKVTDLYRRIYPHYLEVVQGVAAVYGQPVEQIDLGRFERDFTLHLWCDLLQHERFYRATNFGTGDPDPTHHCSVASYYADGHQIVGVNFDISSDRPHYFQTLEMAGTYKVMGHAVYDLTGESVDGLNEKGLSLCVASSAGVRRGAEGWVVDPERYISREPYPTQPAIAMQHMMQIVMQTCATVDEALALLGTVHVWLPFKTGFHWLLADATGKSVIVEWTPGDHELVVFDRPGPYELLTGVAYQDGEAALSACPHYRRAKPLLESGARNTAEMFEVMNGVREPSGECRTLWTCVMDLNAQNFQVRYLKDFDHKYDFGF
jgi:predicted choloylglycine hydrolase